MLAANLRAIDWPALLGVSLIAYLTGAVPFAYLVVRLAGKGDIRKLGSGNVGATNVSRVMGRRFAFLVYLLDMLKGLGCAGGALWAVSEGLLPLDRDLAGIAGGFFAIVGHMASVYLGFRGGKGVATASGAMLALAPWAALSALAVWLAAIVWTRTISLASMLAALALPAAWALWGEAGGVERRPLMFGFLLLVTALVLLRHRANMGRLWRGVEPKIGQSPRSASPPEPEGGSRV